MIGRAAYHGMVGLFRRLGPTALRNLPKGGAAALKGAAVGLGGRLRAFATTTGGKAALGSIGGMAAWEGLEALWGAISPTEDDDAAAAHSEHVRMARFISSAPPAGALRAYWNLTAARWLAITTSTLSKESFAALKAQFAMMTESDRASALALGPEDFYGYLLPLYMQLEVAETHSLLLQAMSEVATDGVAGTGAGTGETGEGIND